MATVPSNPIRLQNPQAPFAGQGLRVPVVQSFRRVLSQQPSPRDAQRLALRKEPEDASLTGGTRSLDRRLLALNLYGRAVKARLLPSRPAQLPCSTAA